MSKVKREKKKQHYVPQSYLKRFSIDGSSVFVFDKFTRRVFRTNVSNVAVERYFYDFPVETTDNLDVDVQLVENALAEIDAAYSSTIDSILHKVRRNTGETLLQPSHRTSMSYYVALQAMRTREQRTVQTQLMEKTTEAILDKTAEHQRDEYKIQANADYVSLLQSLSMFGPVVQAIASALLEHIWLVGVNQTGQPPPYTSDNPVVRKAHKKDPYDIRSYAGFGSEGIEIALPITPKHILMLCERTFH